MNEATLRQSALRAVGGGENTVFMGNDGPGVSLSIQHDREGEFMPENELAIMSQEATGSVMTTMTDDTNVFRQGVREDKKKRMLAKHRLWLESIQHEYPLPYQPFRIGVYIRFFNQTKYSDAVYLEKHKQWYLEDIAMCKRWELVDFYVDRGSSAPHMEYSPEWCRLLQDAFLGKVDLIVTQKAGNVSERPEELTFISRILATQNHPVGIYFISEDIYTLASYYRGDLTDQTFLPEDWERLPEDELDMPMLSGSEIKMLSDQSGIYSGSESEVSDHVEI